MAVDGELAQVGQAADEDALRDGGVVYDQGAVYVVLVVLGVVVDVVLQALGGGVDALCGEVGELGGRHGGKAGERLREGRDRGVGRGGRSGRRTGGRSLRRVGGGERHQQRSYSKYGS